MRDSTTSLGKLEGSVSWASRKEETRREVNGRYREEDGGEQKMIKPHHIMRNLVHFLSTRVPPLTS